MIEQYYLYEVEVYNHFSLEEDKANWWEKELRYYKVEVKLKDHKFRRNFKYLGVVEKDFDLIKKEIDYSFEDSREL